MIKSFEEFKNTNALDEGLFDVFKIRKQITKLQGVVVDEYEKMLSANPKKFKDAESVLKSVEGFAYNAYKKIVTAEDALSFDQWWKNFNKAHTYLLDSTIFNNPAAQNASDDEEGDEHYNHDDAEVDMEE
jgi:hypothetical protein